MKFLERFACVFVPTVTFVCAAQESDAAPSTDLGRAWIGARLIDGTGRPPIENAILLIRGGRIEGWGKRVKGSSWGLVRMSKLILARYAVQLQSVVLTLG